MTFGNLSSKNPNFQHGDFSDHYVCPWAEYRPDYTTHVEEQKIFENLPDEDF